jgi:hypothetical protein
MGVTDWAADKLAGNEDIEILERTPENFLSVRWRGDYTFNVAVLGVKNVIGLTDVQPLFLGTNKPQLVINVPSKTLWSGAAIDHVHDESASFGTFGDISRAASTGDAGSYRDKDMGYFITMLSQHGNVASVSYVYDKVFRANRITGTSLVVAISDAYNLSAEDVRNARSQFGAFDVIIKASSYGSITSQAEAAAQSMGAQALTYGELMRRLGN